ncbi:signal peptidase I [Pseudoxanthomonas putridarboris]|uniref:Signal peptidase I n=1 Tax=Pseudoxanthomonas putridarboris TaxID=752605 RepID=A0ABU9IY68_9GAMM
MTGARRWIVRLLVSLMVVIPTASAVVYFINPFGVRSLDPRQRITGHGLYRVPSSNMEPTVMPGQVLVTRAGYYARQSPSRGDVVTLLIPEHPGQVWLQRIVGLPGETIAIEAGRVHVDGRPLEENYVSPDNRRADYSLTMPAVTVPAGHYFMMGDNRDNSMDSRWQPLTRREDITGKVIGSFK